MTTTIEMNVKYTFQYKKYQVIIPSFLYNLPRWFDLDVLDKRGKVTVSMITSVDVGLGFTFKCKGKIAASTIRCLITSIIVLAAILKEVAYFVNTFSLL